MTAPALPPGSPVRGLYGITPEWDDGERLADAVRAAARGGLRLLQWRRKHVSGPARLAQARALRDVCAGLGVAFIVNDDWRLALDVGAEGVHLGKDDGDIAAVRRQAGAGLLIGASCYDRIELARAALAAGADYGAFGAVFDSPTKPAAVHAPLSRLAEARALALPDRPALRPPIVAIGGITPGNAPQAVAAGADALAVITALFGADDVEAAARAFARAFDAVPPSPVSEAQP